jgi:hypothetical protein
MMASKYKMPDLRNATDAFIVDELAKLSIVENYAKKLRAYYKETLYSRRGINPLAENIATTDTIGEMFVATTKQYPSTRVSADKVKEAHPDDWETLYGTTINILTTTFALKAGVDNPDMNALLEEIKRELELD